MARKNCDSPIQKPFPLLNLPPEIRNRIWRYTLVKDGEVEICLYKRQRMAPSRLRSGKELLWHGIDDERRFNTTSLALTSTSRQLYQEATFIYYSKNTFSFANSWFPFPVHEVFQKFAAAIGKQNASCITAVHFSTTNPSFVQHLHVLPGLKQLKCSAALLSYLPTPDNSHWSRQMRLFAMKHPAVIITECERSV